MRTLATLCLLWGMLGCDSGIIPKERTLVQICGTTHWRHGRYWEWEADSVKDDLVCDKDGRLLEEVTYGNPSPTEEWTVCSPTSGRCYGSYLDKAHAVIRAESLATGEANHK